MTCRFCFHLAHSQLLYLLENKRKKALVFYSLKFNILDLANCQVHREICHYIASMIIIKKHCYGSDYSESLKASNRVVSLSRNTQIVDIDILICGTVCSKPLHSLHCVIKQRKPTHTPCHTHIHTHTHIISVHRLVRWQVGPFGG